MAESKDAMAARLAEAHYQIDPDIDEIVRVVSRGSEGSGDEPIKLLEVNRETTLSGIVPVYFGPHAASGILYPSIIIEVRPEEWEKIRAGELALPHDWVLDRTLPRPLAAGSEDR